MGRKKGDGPNGLPWLGFISDQEITNFLSQQYRIPTIDLNEYEIAADILALVTRELCEELRVIPVSRAGTSLIVAMLDPNDDAKERLRRETGFDIEPVLTTEKALLAAIAKYYGR